MGVAITGMHRSGTSMLGQWAARAGLVMGDGPLFTTDTANPRGLFERQDVVEFNDRWLADLGGSWWAPPFVTEQMWRSLDPHRLETARDEIDLFQGANSNWFVKDPRLCALLPLWDRLCLQRLPVVAAVRQPRAVAMSLHVRNGTTLRRGLALWVAYNRALFKQAQERHVLVLELERTFAEPTVAADALLGLLAQVGLKTTGDAGKIAADVEPRLLRQHSERLQGSAERLAEDLDEMYSALCEAHALPQRHLGNPVHVPDWAAEALAELTQEWAMRVRLNQFEMHAHQNPLPQRSVRSLLRRLRDRGV